MFQTSFRNIFFDLGGVLFNLNTRLALRRFAELGMPISDHVINGDNPFNASAEGEYIVRLIHEVDLGNVRAPQFLSIIRQQCRPGVTDEQILDAFTSMIDVPLSRLQLLQRLHEHYPLYLVSNIGDLHWEAASRMAAEKGYPLENLFDRCFCSYQMGVAKPDPEYFRRAITQSGVNPAETLYIDDAPANIQTGRQAGLIAYQIAGNDLEDHLPTLFPAIL